MKEVTRMYLRRVVIDNAGYCYIYIYIYCCLLKNVYISVKTLKILKKTMQ